MRLTIGVEDARPTMANRSESCEVNRILDSWYVMWWDEASTLTTLSIYVQSQNVNRMKRGFDVISHEEVHMPFVTATPQSCQTFSGRKRLREVSGVLTRFTRN
jgi:hypothetical protein